MNFSWFGKLNITITPFNWNLEDIRLKNLEPKFSFKEWDKVKGFDWVFEKKVDGYSVSFKWDTYYRIKIKDITTNLFVNDQWSILTYEKKWKIECVIWINQLKENNIFINMVTVPESIIKSMKTENLFTIAKDEGKWLLLNSRTEQPIEITAPNRMIYNIVNLKESCKIWKWELMTYKVDVDDYLSMFKKTIIINWETLEPLVIWDKMVTNIEHKEWYVYIFTVEWNQNYEINLDQSVTIWKKESRDTKEYNDRKLGIWKERNVDAKEYNDRLLGIKK